MAMSEEMRKRWEAVRANQARLESCPGPHDWEDIPESRPHAVKDKRCRTCGGTVERIHFHYYNEGLAHANALMYRLARILRNPDEMTMAQWAAEAGHALVALRAIDPERYDREVKQ
jgi:hypothetical protein